MGPKIYGRLVDQVIKIQEIFAEKHWSFWIGLDKSGVALSSEVFETWGKFLSTWKVLKIHYCIFSENQVYRGANSSQLYFLRKSGISWC